MALIPGQDTVVQLLPACGLCLFVSAIYNKPRGGVLGFSSDGDDRRIFLGLKFSIPGFFWVRKFGKYVFGVA